MSQDWWIWLVIGFLLGGVSVFGALWWWVLRDFMFWPTETP